MPPPKIPSILSPLLLFADTVGVGAPPPLTWITPRAPTAFLSRLSDSGPFLCCKVTFCTRNSEWRPLQNLTTACMAGELGTAFRILGSLFHTGAATPLHRPQPSRSARSSAPLRLYPATFSAYGAFALLCRAKFCSSCRTRPTVHGLPRLSKHKLITSL